MAGLALIVFLFGAVAGFVGWSVALIDPKALSDDAAYKGEEGKRRGGR